MALAKDTKIIKQVVDKIIDILEGGGNGGGQGSPSIHIEKAWVANVDMQTMQVSYTDISNRLQKEPQMGCLYLSDVYSTERTIVLTKDGTEPSISDGGLPSENVVCCFNRPEDGNASFSMYGSFDWNNQNCSSIQLFYEERHI